MPTRRSTTGKRVVVLSDSCHSGTVLRKMYEQVLNGAPAVWGAYERVAPWLRTRSGVASKTLRFRGAPAEVQRQVLVAHRALYEGIRARTPRSEEISVRASVILISGCQDNQELAEQNGHGVFTASLLQQWNAATFTGDYRALHEAIRRDLPPTQTPNYFTVGTSWPGFERQVPFTVDPPDGEQPSESPPSVEIVVTDFGRGCREVPKSPRPTTSPLIAPRSGPSSSSFTRVTRGRARLRT